MSTVTIRIDALYYLWDACWDGCPYPARPHSCTVVRELPVTKVTAKRIYFQKWDRTYFVDRATLEREGSISHRRISPMLYLEPPELPEPERPPSLAELRRNMAEAHPDVGGDPEAFREARARYVAAKGGDAR